MDEPKKKCSLVEAIKKYKLVIIIAIFIAVVAVFAFIALFIFSYFKYGGKTDKDPPLAKSTTAVPQTKPDNKSKLDELINKAEDKIGELEELEKEDKTEVALREVCEHKIVEIVDAEVNSTTEYESSNDGEESQKIELLDS